MKIRLLLSILFMVGLFTQTSAQLLLASFLGKSVSHTSTNNINLYKNTSQKSTDSNHFFLSSYTNYNSTSDLIFYNSESTPIQKSDLIFDQQVIIFSPTQDANLKNRYTKTPDFTYIRTSDLYPFQLTKFYKVSAALSGVFR